MSKYHWMAFLAGAVVATVGIVIYESTNSQDQSLSDLLNIVNPNSTAQ